MLRLVLYFRRLDLPRLNGIADMEHIYTLCNHPLPFEHLKFGV